MLAISDRGVAADQALQRGTPCELLRSNIGTARKVVEHAKEEARAGRTADVRLDLMLDQIAKNMVRHLMQADHFRRRFARIL